MGPPALSAPAAVKPLASKSPIVPAVKPLVDPTPLPTDTATPADKTLVATPDHADDSAKPQKVEEAAAPPSPNDSATPAAKPALPPAIAHDAVAMNSASPTPARQPGLPVQSADPAPKSDSEIDPFTQTASAELRAGKMVVRAGRKAKLTRPRLPLAGFWDGVAMGHAAVTMRLTIEASGKVARADVLQSSGSNEIDNPICLEAYNWWFEPNKNAAGEPVKTVIPFTVVVFR